MSRKGRKQNREYKSNQSLIMGGWDSINYHAHIDPTPPKEYTPEEKLMLAVIVQAVEDATSILSAPLQGTSAAWGRFSITRAACS